MRCINFQCKIIHFSLPDNLGKGACIWEPLNWRSGLFNQNEEVTDLFEVYDEISEKYLVE